MTKNKDLSKMIKEARTNKGLSQSDLANKLFISKQSVSKYENSKAIPSKEILNKLEQILETDLVSVFEDKSVSISRKNSYLIVSLFAILFIGVISLSILLSKSNSDYLELSSNYIEVENEKSDLFDDYTQIENEQNILLDDYNELESIYNSLDEGYTSLIQEILNLQNEYDKLNGYYQSAINTNILDYAGIDIIFTGEYSIDNDDDLGFVLMIKNMTTTSFIFDYDLISVKVKNNTSDTLYEVGVFGGFSVTMPTNSTLTRTITFPLTTEYEFDNIEWFEIYYGGMLVAHVVKN